MYIRLSNLSANTESINPSLKFGLIFNVNTNQVITSVSGKLIVEGKVVSSIHEMNSGGTNSFDIRSPNGNAKMNDVYLYFQSEFSQKAVDFLESARERSVEKTLNFSIELQVKYLELPALNPSKFPNQSENFLSLVEETCRTQFSINQSDWVNKYATFFGTGRFMLLEMAVPENQSVPPNWIDLYDRLTLRLQEMEAAIKEGDWQKTMIAGRQFYENLKFDEKRYTEHKEFKEELKGLFLDDQHTPTGFDDFYKGVVSFFNYISKFFHDKSNVSGSLNPRPIATKEDAYLAYALGISVLNVVGKKLSKVAG